MKTIIAILAMLATAPAYAGMYKCVTNGKTTYQERPCKGVGGEFKLRTDISPEQQQAAKERLEAELAKKAENSQANEDKTGSKPPNMLIIPSAAQSAPAPAPSNPGIDMIYNSPGTLN